MHTALSQELAWRGFAYQTTLPDDALDNKKFTFYWGVDPSSDSMTIGNLATAMMVRHFISHGHKAILLVGGATGVIGDPDGKSKERILLGQEQLERNKQVITDQYKTIFAGQKFEIVDNAEWFNGIKYIDFLRDVGKHVPMRQMLGREFVQSRLGEEGPGISYAEFSYSLIQGYDFLHLFRTKGVALQVCGSDQWGNAIAGVELIRRIENKEAHVWSAPLVINQSTGEKFGKTEAGAIWLSAAKTSPFDFYQFWLNVDDASVEAYLKVYTLLNKSEIEKIIAEFKQNPGQRKAQKILANEVTKLIHGDQGLKSAIEHTERLSVSPSPSQPTDVQARAGDSLVDVLARTELVGSKSEARRLLESGGIYINDKQVKKLRLEETDFIDGHLKLRRGKTLQNTVFISLKKS